MNLSTITVFGRTMQVSPRTAKLFLFGWLPLLLAVSLFNGYLLIDAASLASGIPFFWVLVLGVVLTFTLTLKDNGAEKVLGLLKKGWQRDLFGALLIGHGLYFYASTQQPVFVYSLAAFSVFVLVSKAGAHVERVKKEAKAEGERLAKAAAAAGYARPSRTQDAVDIDFKEVRR